MQGGPNVANTSFQFPTIRPPKAEEEFGGDGGTFAASSGPGLTGDIGGGGGESSATSTESDSGDEMSPFHPESGPPTGLGGNSTNFNLPGLTLGDPTSAPEVPGGSGMQGDLTSFARGAMENPSRFDIPFVEQASGLIDEKLGEAREESSKRLDERMAQRGLTGSSVAAEQSAEMEENLERQRMERMLGLEEMVAQTAAQDRQAAANIGLGAGQFGEDVASRVFGQGMQQSQFQEGQRRFGGQMQLEDRAQQLQAQGMAADDAFRQAQLEQERDLTTRGQDIQQQLADQDRRMQALRSILQALGSVGLGNFEGIFGEGGDDGSNVGAGGGSGGGGQGAPGGGQEGSSPGGNGDDDNDGREY